MLLGEITGRIGHAVRVGESCVVVGWRIASEGRKHRVGTAIYGDDRRLCGSAVGLWIEPRPAMQSRATFDSSLEGITVNAA